MTSRFAIHVHARPYQSGDGELVPGALEVTRKEVTICDNDKGKDSCWQVRSVINGKNASIIAYGTTGSGKTYTMQGTPQDPGIIPRAAHSLMAHLEHLDAEQIDVGVSFIEIHNDKVHDLLRVDKPSVKIYAGSNGEDTMSDLSIVKIRSADDFARVCSHAFRARKTAATNLNAQSSRSHAIVTLYTSVTRADGVILHGELSLVDLAGSENTKMAGGDAERQKECGAINTSLAHLGRVIADLRAGRTPIYRESMLVRVLKPALNGQSRAALICCVAPGSRNMRNTRNTLEFGSRAKKVIISSSRPSSVLVGGTGGLTVNSTDATSTSRPRPRSAQSTAASRARERDRTPSQAGTSSASAGQRRARPASAIGIMTPRTKTKLPGHRPGQALLGVHMDTDARAQTPTDRLAPGIGTRLSIPSSRTSRLPLGNARGAGNGAFNSNAPIAAPEPGIKSLQTMQMTLRAHLAEKARMRAAFAAAPRPSVDPVAFDRLPPPRPAVVLVPSSRPLRGEAEAVSSSHRVLLRTPVRESKSPRADLHGRALGQSDTVVIPPTLQLEPPTPFQPVLPRSTQGREEEPPGSPMLHAQPSTAQRSAYPPAPDYSGSPRVKPMRVLLGPRPMPGTTVAASCGAPLQIDVPRPLIGGRRLHAQEDALMPPPPGMFTPPRPIVMSRRSLHGEHEPVSGLFTPPRPVVISRRSLHREEDAVSTAADPVVRAEDEMKRSSATTVSDERLPAVDVSDDVREQDEASPPLVSHRIPSSTETNVSIVQASQAVASPPIEACTPVVAHQATAKAVQTDVAQFAVPTPEPDAPAQAQVEGAIRVSPEASVVKVELDRLDTVSPNTAAGTAIVEPDGDALSTKGIAARIVATDDKAKESVAAEAAVGEAAVAENAAADDAVVEDVSDDESVVGAPGQVPAYASAEGFSFPDDVEKGDLTMLLPQLVLSPMRIKPAQTWAAPTQTQVHAEMKEAQGEWEDVDGGDGKDEAEVEAVLGVCQRFAAPGAAAMGRARSMTSDEAIEMPRRRSLARNAPLTPTPDSSRSRTGRPSLGLEPDTPLNAARLILARTSMSAESPMRLRPQSKARSSLGSNAASAQDSDTDLGLVALGAESPADVLPPSVAGAGSPRAHAHALLRTRMVAQLVPAHDARLDSALRMPASPLRRLALGQTPLSPAERSTPSRNRQKAKRWVKQGRRLEAEGRMREARDAYKAAKPHWDTNKLAKRISRVEGQIKAERRRELALAHSTDARADSSRLELAEGGSRAIVAAGADADAGPGPGPSRSGLANMAMHGETTNLGPGANAANIAGGMSSTETTTVFRALPPSTNRAYLEARAVFSPRTEVGGVGRGSRLFGAPSPLFESTPGLRAEF